MSEDLFARETDGRGVCRITLTRPDVHNSFNADLVAGLAAALEEVDRDRDIRVLVLAAEGKSFSAGADLNWMRDMASESEERNLEDARALARLMHRLDRLSKPTLALVQGAAIGGGVGLVACSDIALASENAVFALAEVRLGIIPSVISPYVAAAIGERQLRRYALTAERFPASEAARLGLVHEVVDVGGLETRGETFLDALLAGGPSALAQCKSFIARIARRPVDEGMIEESARGIARLRASDEGREGIAAFLEKRKPAWHGKQGS